MNHTCCILLFLAYVAGHPRMHTENCHPVCCISYMLYTAAVVWVVYYSNSHCFKSVARNVMTWPWLPLHLSIISAQPQMRDRSLWFIQILYHFVWPRENVPAICICRSVGLLSWKRILSSFTRHLSMHVPLLSNAAFNDVCTSINEIAWIVQACLSEEHQSVLFRTANGDLSHLSLITLIKSHNTEILPW